MLIQALIELLFSGTGWGRKLSRISFPRGQMRPTERWDRSGISGPLHGLERLTTFICTHTFTLKFITVSLPGWKYIICTLHGLSVMIMFTLWLINAAKSDFSAVIGQYMKKKEVGVEIDMCPLGRDCLICKVKICYRWQRGKEGVEYVIPLGGPGKDRDSPKVWLPLCVGPHVCVLVSWIIARVAALRLVIFTGY